MKVMDNIKKRSTLAEFGFGEEIMKSITVCINCSSMEESKNLFCAKCGARLPRVNLYDFYEAQHLKCKECGTVLSDSMCYCPKCGIAVNKVDTI